MANRNTKAKIKALRKAKQHFHGKICPTHIKSRKPRDEKRALLAQGQKRQVETYGGHI